MNKKIFGTTGNSAPETTAVNDAGGKAYSRSVKNDLATLACVGTFNGTYYCNDEDALKHVKDAVAKLKGEPEFVAKLAVYARKSGFMKDMPSFLVAQLAAWGETDLLKKVFPVVIDNGKMLRNYMQIGRSGQAGRVLNMSSSCNRSLINNWFQSRDSDYIFRASIGNDPSMRDMLRMARPKPEKREKEALYAYLKGATKVGANYVTYNKDKTVKYSVPARYLPKTVKEFEKFKETKEGDIPDVDFRMLDSILNEEQRKALWTKQAEIGNWHMTRMNLNNFQKYGVFNDAKLTKLVADRLKNAELVRKSKVFPYQLLIAYQNTTNVPSIVREALQDAMEIAVDNVPEFDTQTYVCIDTSGSMGYSAMGSAQSTVTCVDVAALFASAVIRRNKLAEVIPFDTEVRHVQINPRDSILTNAKKLALRGGGTDVACSLRHLNKKNAKGGLVVIISDSESWCNPYGGRSTGTMAEWENYRKRNPNAKLVCIDILANRTSQVVGRKDILQVSSFSDSVFSVIDSFLKGKGNWTDVIESVEI